MNESLIKKLGPRLKERALRDAQQAGAVEDVDEPEAAGVTSGALNLPIFKVAVTLKGVEEPLILAYHYFEAKDELIRPPI